MFKLFSIVAVAIASASLVAAGGDLKLCTKINLTGECFILSYLNNECIELNSVLDDHVRSVDPVGDGHKCYLFEDQGCSGDHFDFTKHHNDLGSFNDLASSFYCNNA
ncbi:hypothetical protein D9615_006195 [Tricholomella constricta]|uniref:Uncharacterized protein n=1 Tax=Tricholomella constricta TaxID=117010 RepID=A0A8H5M3R9_9AGAR|nr:hypothetical protein D9615_006195 [Tricholomella constricta]